MEVKAKVNLLCNFAHQGILRVAVSEQGAYAQEHLRDGQSRTPFVLKQEE